MPDNFVSENKYNCHLPKKTKTKINLRHTLGLYNPGKVDVHNFAPCRGLDWKLNNLVKPDRLSLQALVKPPDKLLENFSKKAELDAHSPPHTTICTCAVASLQLLKYYQMYLHGCVNCDLQVNY